MLDELLVPIRMHTREEDKGEAPYQAPGVQRS
jgi:hypothetical protein